MTEIWLSAWAGNVDEIEPQAVQAEEAGVDGMFISDSQNLWLDFGVVTTVVARATSQLKLGTATINPVTRHPAVAACVAASLQEVCGGRYLLGIGRGNSALTLLGYGPAPLSVLRSYVAKLQGYLGGEGVPFDTAGDLPDMTRFGYVPTTETSRIRWLPDTQPKVPVHVNASGPKSIKLAAELGDGVIFALGADAAKIGGLLEQVDEERAAAGLAGKPFVRTANLAVIPHSDPEVAKRLAAGVAPSVAATQNRDLRSSYDVTRHYTSQVATASDDVITRYSIAGTPDYCVERLRQLANLGIDRISFPLRIRGATDDEQAVVTPLVLKEVVPNFRA